MKKTLSFVLSLVMVLCVLTSVPVTAYAQADKYLSFSLNADGKSYSVSDYKWFADCDSYLYTDVVIPSTYNGKPVTSINDQAFWEGDITSIVIPDSIISIGDCAFWRCENLTSIVIPEGVTSIGENTFGACSNLKTVTLPDSLTYLGSWAFGTCVNLTSIVIPDKVNSIKGETFQSCVNLTSVTLGDGVKYIWDDAFNSCKSLTSIKIPDSVEYIGSHAFANCTSMKSVVIPGSVTTIGEESFGYIFDENYEYKKVKNFTVSGIKNTAAEDYANTNGFDFVKIECKHKSAKWVTAKKATANNSGLRRKTCTICKKVLKTATIPQLKCAKPRLKSVANVATGIKFTWNKVTGADNYEIYRKTGKNSWKKVATVKGKVNTYTDKKVKSGTTYKYTVKASNEVGLSKYSTTGLTIICIADPVLKTPKSTKKGITLKWNKVTGAQGYVVYRKAGQGKFVKLTTVKGVSKVSYTDKSAKKGTKYTYQLKAYRGKTYSAYSNLRIIKDKY